MICGYDNDRGYDEDAAVTTASVDDANDNDDDKYPDAVYID
jgi:hypothetical protein